MILAELTDVDASLLTKVVQSLGTSCNRPFHQATMLDRILTCTKRALGSCSTQVASMNLTLDLCMIMLFAWVGYSEAKERGRSQCTTDGGSELDHLAKEKLIFWIVDRESNDCTDCKELNSE